MTEPRKATDVLLEIESKLDALLKKVDANDLNVKVVSNKLGEVMKGLDKLQSAPQQQKFSVEAVHSPVPNQAAMIFGQVPTSDPARALPVTAESKLPVDETPQGFRRTSRPESYDTTNSYAQKEVIPEANPSIFVKGTGGFGPPPGRVQGEGLPTNQPAPPKKTTQSPTQPQPAKPIPVQKPMTEAVAHGIVPVEQRVVDRNGKSVFLADVEIVDLSTGDQVSKSRTNGTGKWMAALPIGQYRVTIKKLESLTREKVEAIQTVTVDGTESPLKLQMVIIK